MIFRYEAVDIKGVRLSGNVDAASEVQAIRELNGRGLTLIALAVEPKNPLPTARKKASTDEILMSLHELVTLLEAGVSVADTLESQCSASYPADLANGYTVMAAEIQKGSSFSDALRLSKIRVPIYMLQLAEAGELVGDLSGSLRKGLSQYEYELNLAKEFRTALAYPSILILSGLAAVTLIFALVVPKFLPMMEKAENLPLISEIVFTAGTFFNENMALVALIALAFTSILVSSLRTQKIREKLYETVIRWPLLGAWLIETDIARWCSTLAALLGSRVDLIDSLSLANQGVFSTKRRARFARTIEHLKNGEGLADALEKESVLTSVGYNLIRSGERSGNVVPMVNALSKLYDDAGKNRMKRVIALIEPLSILVIGVFVGTIVLGVMLAITSVNVSGV